MPRMLTRNNSLALASDRYQLRHLALPQLLVTSYGSLVVKKWSALSCTCWSYTWVSSGHKLLLMQYPIVIALEVEFLDIFHARLSLTSRTTDLETHLLFLDHSLPGLCISLCLRSSPLLLGDVPPFCSHVQSATQPRAEHTGDVSSRDELSTFEATASAGMSDLPAAQGQVWSKVPLRKLHQVSGSMCPNDAWSSSAKAQVSRAGTVRTSSQIWGPAPTEKYRLRTASRSYSWRRPFGSWAARTHGSGYLVSCNNCQTWKNIRGQVRVL